MRRDFHRVAIVNRGEPAMRFINAARELNAESAADLHCIALFTEPDRHAMFVREADESFNLGAPTFFDLVDWQRRNRYLAYQALERALRESGAEAAWVGWGFVAEHAEFVELCDRLNVAFIGPSASVMRQLGNKIAAKALAERAGVPIAPWTGGPVETLDAAREHARRIGYPLVIKAAAGGGGRGIRRVLAESELESAFERARAEALSAFGDPSVYFEQMMVGVRHIEVQIIADCFGTTWALGLRDCSIQRRNQKLLEEAPPPGITADMDQALREAAARLCTAAGYENAGTVEFLFDPARNVVSFMEVNTRLQVEHPVTELTTGCDLVKLQIHVARGGRLEGQPPITSGHAIEVRLNAEDPENGFSPSPGSIELLRFPTGPGVRIDTGVAERDVVPPDFDSMIAKIIAHGTSRSEALARLRRALSQCAITIRGGTTNRAFLLELLNHPDVIAGAVDVSWLDRVSLASLRTTKPDAAIAILRSAIDAYEAEFEIDKARFYSSAARGRPEAREDGGRTVELRYEGHSYRITTVRVGRFEYRMEVDGAVVDVAIECLGRAPIRERRGQGVECWLTCAGRRFRTFLADHGPTHFVEVDGATYRITRDEQGLVRAPAPSLVVSVAVKPGDEVAVGDRLVVLEAMKMETTITASFAGTVRQVMVLSNTQVGTGAPLLVIEAQPEAGVDVASTRVPFDTLQLAEATGIERRRQILAELRGFMLGYDLRPGSLKRLMKQWSELPPLDDTDAAQLLIDEIDLLEIVADTLRLFHRRSPGDELDQAAHLSGEVYLFSYLRNLDADSGLLPASFLDQLKRTLAHFGVDRLDVTAALKESLFRIWRAHQREEEIVTPTLALLEHRLEHPLPLAQRPADWFRSVLDGLVAGAQGRHPSLSDLARDVRYRYFERPLLEDARRAVYADAEIRLAQLARPLAPADRARHVEALVDCPQPLAALLSSRFKKAKPLLREAMLEALNRRYYRIRDLQNVHSVIVRRHIFTVAEYDHDGSRIHVLTTYGHLSRLKRVMRRAASVIAEVPADHDVVLDVYLWHRRTAPERDRLERNIREILDKARLPRPLRRIVIAVTSQGHGPTATYAQYFTFRSTDEGYKEEAFYRDVHPMMAKRLKLELLANFNIERLPSVEDVYAIHGVAKSNPKDERLFVVAEVRDLTPVRDDTGRVVQVPQLERMYMEALAGIRRFQLKRPADRRLYWNRVFLYIWPAFDLRRDELKQLADRMMSAAEGLGVETVFLSARVPRPGTTRVKDRVISISNPFGREPIIRFGAPTQALIAPLTEYEQQVVRQRQRGLSHSYELLRMLAPQRDGRRTAFPPGEFIEHDLDGDGRLVPIQRDPGRNVANVVVGVIRNFTERYPEGMTRVILVGDPSRELGSLAEPECRRIIGAIDLADRMRVPLEWIALSAGAKISMESGTENMDWIAAVLRRIVNFTQGGGEVNIIVNGINVGAQPYWNAEATMLMHTRGILVMMPDSAMVLTGKRALDYSGGVSAEDNQGIGGYERIMGPNGESQYFARDLNEAGRILFDHYDHTYVRPGERFPRPAQTRDPIDRDVRLSPYGRDNDRGFLTIGDVFSDEKNPGRKAAFDIRTVMRAVSDQDRSPLERWQGWRDAETGVVWDAHLGGYPICLIGFESQPLQRFGFVPADGPEQWTAGTLFPQSSRKVARAINAASGNRPVVVLANLTGFDGSPESLRNWQLEYGAEIGRAVVNFRGPIVFCVVSRYHGGAFVVFSQRLNDNMVVLALEGTHASVIGGAPAAAVVFAREVEKRTRADARVKELQQAVDQAPGPDKARLQARLSGLLRAIQSEKLGDVADEFDTVHSVERALRVHSIDEIIPVVALRPRLIQAIEQGMKRETEQLAFPPLAAVGV